MKIRLSMVNVWQYKFIYRKRLHFMTFCTKDFITDWSIMGYRDMFSSIPVKNKLATPALGST